MAVSEILSRKGGEVITVSENADLTQAARVLDERKIGTVVILNTSGAPAGVLSERDIARAVARMGAAALRTPVTECMTRDVIVCRPCDSLDQIMELMTDRRIRHLPVMEQGRLVGLVSIGDIVKQKLSLAEADAGAMMDYIMSG